MSLAPGTRIGPYEVTALIGEGGMGQVYRAHDERLRRDVAIKSLPELVASDPERLARFEREAQLLASLNHPNIAAIYGLERSNAGPVIVMELVEGRTLEEMLRPAGAPPAPLPPGEAWAIGRQIADGLEAAHERGIIHRDLKPANIRVTPDGQAKLLDFGLGKALAGDGSQSPAAPTESPTLTARATELGMIMGTAAYMPPEQARGKAVDRRADVWAFGVVLYEMVTGTRAFPGDEITDVLAKVIEREPDLTRLPASTPPSIRNLVARCLTKDPRQRLRDIGEARILLDDVMAGRNGSVPEAEAARSQPASRRWFASPLLGWSAAGLLLVAFGLALGDRGGGNTRLVAASLNMPSDLEFFGVPRLSADGSVAAFFAVRAGIRQIFVRRLDDWQMREVAGSASTSALAVSPDGTQVAMVSNTGDLMRLSIDGTASQRLATGADFVTGLAWSLDDQIVFGREGRLWTIPAVGGDARALTTLDAGRGEIAHRQPVVSTDSAFVFYTSTGTNDQNALHGVDLGTGRQFEALPEAYQAIAAFPDRLVLARDGALFAAHMRDGQVTETPTRVREDVTFAANLGFAASVSASGDLLAAGSAVSLGRLVWVTSDGTETPVIGSSREYANPRVSPDGRRVVFSAGDGLWTLDLERGALTKLAPSGAGYAQWAGSDHIVYRSSTTLAMIRADGTGGEQALTAPGFSDFPASVSPDGRTLAFIRISPVTAGDIYVMPLDGSEAPRSLFETPAYEGGGQFSPDGRWIAYTSDEGGEAQVYLSPYPQADRRYSVSPGGGLHPLWSPDGRHIYYRDGQRLMAVDVTPGPEPALSPPRLLFDQQYRFGPNLSIPHYSLSPDGKRFLFVREEPGARSLDLVTNWLETLDRR
jgi:Tol biopolymer transport system component